MLIFGLDYICLCIGDLPQLRPGNINKIKNHCAAVYQGLIEFDAHGEDVLVEFRSIRLLKAGEDSLFAHVGEPLPGRCFALVFIKMV